jgi:hypothetical protein
VGRRDMPVNKVVSQIITARFEAMCLEGHFPEVNLVKKSEFGAKITSYNMMEYTEFRTRLATLIHEQLAAAGYTGGIFATRLRSQAYLGAARSFADRFTNVDVRACSRRLKSWMD